LAGRRVVIVGAGIGGLSAAIELSAQGAQVTVVEQGAAPGGKMREAIVGDARIDAGPTVLTMRDVFDGIFARSGANLSDYVELEPADVLARHVWDGGGELDLYADLERTADAIGVFSGTADAKGYRAFCREAQSIYRVLDRSFIRAQKPSLPQLIWRIGPHRLGDLWRINPYQTLWNAIGLHITGQRLRQLLARYSTYCGSSPFYAPATLMLVAHVERQGVWLVVGGMHKLATMMAKRASECGAVFRFATRASEVIVENGRAKGVRLGNGERLGADAVVVNADISVAASGALGRALARKVSVVSESARSLSALTWAMKAQTAGFSLARHTTFFSREPYTSEFEAIFARGALPAEPTVYVCAQDRDGGGELKQPGAERLLCVVNAPACHRSRPLRQSEIDLCERKTFGLTQRCGLSIRSETTPTIRTTPADFAELFPGTGGAIYGRASHGWIASFRRQGARSRIPGVYFAGGSCHPGPGVPMAALSGQLAAEAFLKDFASARRFHPAGTLGGISMHSATTAASD
jgi:1-hydroxycarotenoid 3,4-desaturase